MVNLPQRQPVAMRTARAQKVIGVPFNDELDRRYLHAPGPAIHPGRRRQFSVTSPSYRFDIEIEEDLIEEVARVYGKHPDLAARPRTRMQIAPEKYPRCRWQSAGRPAWQ